MELRLYQKEIVDEVKSLIQQGKKRINTILPAGAGATSVACVIANEILCNAIVVIHTLERCDFYKNKQKEEYPESNALVISAKHFWAKKEEAFEISVNLAEMSFLLLGTTPSERKQLQSVIPKDATVVTISNTPLFSDGSSDLLNLESITGNVFYANELFDVRDIISAIPSDIKITFEQINAKKIANENFIRFQKSISNVSTREELEAKIAMLEEENQFYKQMLGSIIPMEKLDICVQEFKKKKLVLSEQISNGDEMATEELSNFIVQKSMELLGSHVTNFNREYFESLIIDSLTNAVWNKMSNESRTYIITSKVAFESIRKIDSDESMDYSGVCILAAKALDIEISNRFFYQYINYLKETTPLEKWPKALFDNDNMLISDEKFTLGSVKYVVGIDEYGEIRSNYTYRMFANYSKSQLYSTHLSETDLKNHLTKCVQCVETVRNNYRNPAAHRTSLDSITAKECIDYLVDTYKKLKEILICMK